MTCAQEGGQASNKWSGQHAVTIPRLAIPLYPGQGQRVQLEEELNLRALSLLASPWRQYLLTTSVQKLGILMFRELIVLEFGLRSKIVV